MYFLAANVLAQMGIAYGTHNLVGLRATGMRGKIRCFER